MNKYRRLEKGEIIQEGDEFDNCANPYKDEPIFVTGTQISSCGCKFESEKSNVIILCDECSNLPCHN